tara:strand:+ start:141 stop:551 length:411 start_codon:yes stop_codon:yes gene_type:complete
MIKNILGVDFKYEDDKLYRLSKWTAKWNCCNDLAPRPSKYISVLVNKKKYYLHRLIYKYHNEDFDIIDSSKNNQIDHIDIEASNNRIENLRVVNHTQNQTNKKKEKILLQNIKVCRGIIKIKNGCQVLQLIVKQKI